MPDNFLKITFKWIAGLLALSFLSNQLFFFWVNNFSKINENGYSLGDAIQIVFPFLDWFTFSIILGFGIRDLVRSNEYKISVGTVFGFVACLIFIPTFFNIGFMYLQAINNENIANVLKGPSYKFSILYSFLADIFYSMIVVTLAAQWRVFRKAGKKGWKSLIPFYNLIIMCDIIKRPRAWVLLFLIPLINFIGLATITNGMARVFKRSDNFSIGLFFLPFIFFPILAFGENEYIHGEYQVVKDDLNIEDHLVE